MDTAKLERAEQAFRQHRQHYLGSCVASCVELVLKIEGRLDAGFHELQDQYQTDTSGMGPFLLEDFADKYKLRFTPVSFKPAALNGIVPLLETEQAASRFPLVALFGKIDPVTNKASGHMHIVVQKFGADYVAFSKDSFLTIGQLVLQSAQRLESTN
ncbi:MAG: hypothetical protein ABI273_09045, partial [Lacunisphaera sp.]